MEQGQMVGLIGPNGAGKTTVFNLVTGVYAPTQGTIAFKDKSLVGLASHQVAERGVARTFQNIRLYNDLPVWENVALGRQFRVKYSIPSAILRLPSFVNEERDIKKKALELLSLFKLDNRANEIAKNLPYGEQRRLEICRALASDPELLLLDEPAAGMNPKEVDQLISLINWVHQEFKLTTLLIEHHMQLVMNICPHIVVLDFGEVICPREPGRNPGQPQRHRGLPGQTGRRRGGGLMTAAVTPAPAATKSVNGQSILTVSNLEVSYGAIQAVKGISFDVKEGEIVTLIGANGAGKSTTLRTISGLIRPSKGTITFRGQEIQTVSPDKIVELGIAHSPEGRRIFANLTVED